MRLRIINKQILLTGDADIAKEILTLPSKPELGYKMLTTLLGKRSLVLDNGDNWKKNRKLLQQSFHINNTDHFYNSIIKGLEPLLDKMENIKKDEWLEIDYEFTKVTINAIGLSMFSKLLAKDKLLESLLELVKETEKRLRNPLRIYYPYSLYKFRQTHKYLIEQFKNIVDEHKITTREKKDMIDMMLSAKEDNEIMSEEEIIDQIITFFFAGHDTTAHTIAWAIYNISTKPNIEKKVIEEIDKITNGRSPNINDIKSLEYLNMVIKEVLRMYPPVTGFSRLMENNTKIADYKIPAGYSIGICVTAIHYSEKYYKDPYIFDPERWNKENSIDRHPYAWLPFSMRDRSCIGKEFGLLELKIVLSILYSKYTFRIDPTNIIGPKMYITTSPFQGIYVQVKKRNKII